MCFRCKSLLAAALVAAAAASFVADGSEVLRVAADPNNLPFSNDRLEGFENKLAALIAAELNVQIEYIWHAQRRGFFRETLKDGNADMVLGVPARFDRALTTRPYYRSGYAFVAPAASRFAVRTLDDGRLRSLRIGVQLVGDDGANTPPVHALVANGLVTNLVGFTLYGDYREANPPARILEAVAKGSVDVAVVWGPLAGYFAKQHQPALDVLLIEQDSTARAFPMEFDISIGVRKGNRELRDRLNGVLERRQAEIERFLDRYGVPRITPSKVAENQR